MCTTRARFAFVDSLVSFELVPQTTTNPNIVAKKLGRKDEALRYFTFAYDLDPKEMGNGAKNALERLEQDEVEEDSF